MPDNLIEVESVSHWNTNLRASKKRAVIVDFHAQWCGPCKAIAPAFKQLAENYPNCTFLRVDVDQQKAIAAKYQISAMPTFIAIRGGEKLGEPIRGADINSVRALVAQHATPPMPKLPHAAEEAKNEANDLFKAGQFADAAAKYTQALEAAPDSAVILTNRSAAYLKAEEAEKALEDAKKAAELDPEWSKAWQRLAEALEASSSETRDTDAIVEAYTKALKLVPKGKQSTEYESRLSKIKQT